jgi:squalene monooxygenase
MEPGLLAHAPPSQEHILTKIVPQLPSSLHLPVQAAIKKTHLQRMPNSCLPAVEQGSRHSKEGVILFGDTWNMRHLLTGGGMTVALHDVVILTQLLKTMHNLGNWDEMSALLHQWHWGRKPLASSINILSVALYDLFRADGVVFIYSLY